MTSPWTAWKSSWPVARNLATCEWDIHEHLSMGHITQLDDSHMPTTMQHGSWTGNMDNNSQHLLGQHEKQFTACGEVFSHMSMGHLVAPLHCPHLHTQPPSSTQTAKHGVLWTRNAYRNRQPVLWQYEKQFTVHVDGLSDAWIMQCSALVNCALMHMHTHPMVRQLWVPSWVHSTSYIVLLWLDFFIL